MNTKRSRGIRPAAGIGLLIVLAVLGRGVCADDAVAEAKRRAAAELMRAAKYDQAISLMGEVIREQAGRYQDQLQLAKLYEGRKSMRQAVEAYHRALELCPASDSSAEAKQARAEADRRLKVLDPMGGKIDAAVEEISKRLTALEREARAGRDADALDRLLTIRTSLVRAQRQGGRWASDVYAETGWQATRYLVQKGLHYRVTAAGVWRFGPGPDTETDADGSPTQSEGAPLGTLYGSVNTQGPFFKLGTDASFTAPHDGYVNFIMHKPTGDRKECSGSIHVFIEPAR